MEEITNQPNNVVRFQEKGLDDEAQDKAIITRWVKGELFDMVKFLYNPDEDLKIDGTLFKLFVRDCRKRLVGLRSCNPANQRDRRDYVVKVWSEATKKRSNLVTDGLSARRSAIYSAMQNRFRGTRVCWIVGIFTAGSYLINHISFTMSQIFAIRARVKT